MNANRKLTWMVTIAAVVVAVVVVSTVGLAQTGEGTGIQAPANDVAAPAGEAPLSPNDVPGTPPSPEQVEAQLNATAAGSAYKVLAPAAFTSDGADPDGYFMSFWNGYFYAYEDYNVCLLAPLELSDGTTISSFEVRLNDDNPNHYESFYLNRTNLETGAVQTMAGVFSPAGTTGGLVALTDNTIDYPVVSDMYAYQVVTCARPEIYVYAVRIGYSSMVSLPLADKSYP